ncbi:MAG: 50S ribosomal protein L18 [Proteobacteria bacterium]|nr:50S ribosomal protein L18 [Pseudomonadota bacterium]
MEGIFAKKIHLTRRRKRVHKKVRGTSERPRLSVSRSLNSIQAQLVDDVASRTMVGVSSLHPEIRGKSKRGGNLAAAQAVGMLLAKKAKEAGIEKVVFDRGRFRYHGGIKLLADKAREAGLVF